MYYFDYHKTPSISKWLSYFSNFGKIKARSPSTKCKYDAQLENNNYSETP